MIEHLRGRDRKLEPLGWTGPDAEWIALVCLHSGVFTRAQFCHYFDARRNRAFRFVQTLVERRMAVESEWPVVNGGAKTCRISSKLIYQALGVENIRHRRKASGNVIMRRLLSLDFVLEHPGMNWLPYRTGEGRVFSRTRSLAALDPAPDLLRRRRSAETLLCAQTSRRRWPGNRHLCLRRCGPPNG